MTSKLKMMVNLRGNLQHSIMESMRTENQRIRMHYAELANSLGQAESSPVGLTPDASLAALLDVVAYVLLKKSAAHPPRSKEWELECKKNLAAAHSRLEEAIGQLTDCIYHVREDVDGES